MRPDPTEQVETPLTPNWVPETHNFRFASFLSYSAQPGQNGISRRNPREWESKDDAFGQEVRKMLFQNVFYPKNYSLHQERPWAGGGGLQGQLILSHLQYMWSTALSNSSCCIGRAESKRQRGVFQPRVSRATCLPRGD